jgi:glycosyltransferase involved in cell wall biosynthesis
MRRLTDDSEPVQQAPLRREILYIGNVGSVQSKGVTVIETLGAGLEERYLVHRASGKRTRAARLVHMLASVALLRKRVSTVLIDTYSTTSFFYALAVSQLCRLLTIPYVAILHGGRLPERLDRSPRLSRSLFLHAAMNVAPSPYLEKRFRENDFPVSVIPNSISISDCPFRPREHHRPRLLFVRALARVYNPEMAIRTLAHLSRRFPRAELCMVGPEREGMRNRCQNLAAELGCADRVSFTGQLEKRYWHQLSARYDIFVNTSETDNMPVSLIEAMALGLPIVSTRSGGIPDLIEDGKDGFLVPRNDPEAMTERIVRLLEDDRLARTLALNGRRKAAQFDWEVVKHHWFRLLG